jgi:hypothetical protein
MTGSNFRPQAIEHHPASVGDSNLAFVGNQQLQPRVTQEFVHGGKLTVKGGIHFHETMIIHLCKRLFKMVAANSPRLLPRENRSLADCNLGPKKVNSSPVAVR